MYTTGNQGGHVNKLNVRFSEIQKMQLNDVSSAVGAKLSDVARAAMYLGMLQIKALAANDTEKAGELIAINNFKAK